MLFRRRKKYSYSNSRERYLRQQRTLPPPRRKRARGMFGLLGEFLSWFGFLLLISGGIVGGGLYFLHTRFDEAVRTHVEAKFRATYPRHQVALRAARRVDGQGIELRGLSIAEVGQNGVALPLATIDELLVRCNTTVEELLAGQLDAKQIVLRGLKLHAARNERGQWNLTSLLPLPQFSQRQLPITVENSSIEVLVPAADGIVPETTEIHLLTLNPVPHPDGVSPSRLWQYSATLAGPHFQQVKCQGDYDVATNVFRADGDARAVQLTPELAALAPAQYRDQASWLKALRAVVNARFQVSTTGVPDTPVRFQVEGDLAGRVEDEQFPFPLTDLKATFRGSEGSLEIREATGRVGNAVLSLSCTIGGFRHDAPCSLKVTAQQLQVDRQLVGTLPAAWGELWNMLAPEGTIDAVVTLDYDGYRTQQTAVVDCRDVSFAHEKYPYRLTGGSGRVEWRDGQLTFDDFRAHANGREVLIRGSVRNPGPDFDGIVTVDVARSVPIDEKLIAAIPESGRQFVQQLDPHGAVTLHAEFERHGTNPPTLRRDVTIGLENCSVDYQKFSYRLAHINGTLLMRDGQWTVRDLHGKNGGASVSCAGGWGPDENGVLRVALEFNAQEVPLADELRDALSPDAQRIWKSLRPRGTIDLVRAAVQYDSQTRQTNLELTATKNPSGGNIKERSITIKPTWLPYQLDDVEGTVHWRKGEADLRQIRARHSDTQVQLDGTVQIASGGEWDAHLETLNVDQLSVTHELATALPPRLSNAVTKLNISGPFSVSGSMNLTGKAGDSSVTSSNWNLEFDIEDGEIDCGVRLEHLRGGVKLAGTIDPRGLASRGTLQFDSLVYKGIQLTQVFGPLTIDDERIAFGERSTRLPDEGPPRPVTGRVVGGTAQGSAEIKLTGDYPFVVEGHLFDGDLATISREATLKRHDISGRTYADIRLQGNSHGTHTLQGTGNVQLRQANLYELPLVARLLKVLTINIPNATAFTASDVNYHIEGDRIYFDHIAFNGDAISLDGKGEMTLAGELDLAFYTMVGRDDFRDLILRPLIKETAKRLVQIQVTGTVAEPNIERQFAPELNNTLQTLFPNPLPGARPNMSRLPNPGEPVNRYPPQ